MDEEQGAGRGFRVTDRRRFTDAGEVRTDPETPPPAAAPQAASGEEPPPSDDTPFTFSTFILGLSTQALVALGEVEHPLSKQAEPNLAAARQLIDIMTLLREKTRGNLQSDEEHLLESVLYDLRMRFVEQVRRSGK